MTDSRPKLSSQKRDQIFRAAIKEFSEKGYDNASTNSITREAGISKGLLFHYFGSKKGLYLSVLEHCVNHYQSLYESKLSRCSSDIFERVLQASANKIEILRSTPEMYRLVMEAFVHTPEDIRTEVLAIRRKSLTEGFDALSRGLDLSRLRSGVSLERVIELLLAVSEALVNKYTSMQRYWLDVMPAAIEELREALAIIRDGAYTKHT